MSILFSPKFHLTWFLHSTITTFVSHWLRKTLWTQNEMTAKLWNSSDTFKFESFFFPRNNSIIISRQIVAYFEWDFVIMTIGDLSDFCRLCLMPLVNGSYIDCGLDENSEFKDTIKTVYNIDVSLKLYFHLTIDCYILAITCSNSLLFLSIRSMLSMNFQRMFVWCAVMSWCTTRFIIIGQ